ncbi:hypothetical protein KAJ27_16095 [bacterium]|nr:hypothetical protein [bacterium]
MKKVIFTTVLAILLSLSFAFITSLEAKTGILIKAHNDEYGITKLASTGNSSLGEELFVIYEINKMRKNTKNFGGVCMKISFDNWNTSHDVPLMVNKDEVPYSSENYMGPLFGEMKIPGNAKEAELYFYLSDREDNVQDIEDNDGLFFRFNTDKLSDIRKAERKLFEKIHEDAI